jgi:hypothetical protein
MRQERSLPRCPKGDIPILARRYAFGETPKIEIALWRTFSLSASTLFQRLGASTRCRMSSAILLSEVQINGGAQGC